MHLTVPATTAPHVANFIRDNLLLLEDLVPLAIENEHGTKPTDCFRNVRAKMLREGGGIRFGWAIWELPGLFIEAEHHGVYVEPDGVTLKDITPCADGNKTRLFVRDDAATYDFDNEGTLRDNIRHPLIQDDALDEFLKVAAMRTRFKNSIPGIGAVFLTQEEQKRLAKLERRWERANHALATKHFPQVYRKLGAE